MPKTEPYFHVSILNENAFPVAVIGWDSTLSKFKPLVLNIPHQCAVVGLDA